MVDEGGGQVATEKDPAEIVATLRRSIEASRRGSRRVRAHRFKDLFRVPGVVPGAAGDGRPAPVA